MGQSKWGLANRRRLPYSNVRVRWSGENSMTLISSQGIARHYAESEGESICLNLPCDSHTCLWWTRASWVPLRLPQSSTAFLEKARTSYFGFLLPFLSSAILLLVLRLKSSIILGAERFLQIYSPPPPTQNLLFPSHPQEPELEIIQ